MPIEKLTILDFVFLMKNFPSCQCETVDYNQLNDRLSQ